MATRPSWEGFLKLSLISVPVRAYGATVSGGGRIGFHLLHAPCQSRIRYKKVCPIHGEVPNDEIVSGYEAAKGEHVVLQSGEIKALREREDKAIRIDTFVPPGAIDPLYFSGRTYYLVPHGQPGQHPFAILHRVMEEQERHAVARVILSGKEQVALVRPLGKVLAMTLLTYAEQLKKPQAFEDEVADAPVSAQELALAEGLVRASTTQELDIARYHDLYAEKLGRLLERKAVGRRKRAGRKAGEPAVINLMDALRQSLDRAQKRTKRPPARPARNRRRKTG